ncbi:hypothetical protein BJY04DRAFT_194596, partial [Aspergillus karnatakaensis]|uniref:E3 ubiquitin-protein ligase SSM4 n=1 Tax=Aspergillus karnatakaensis TaxID=1810916 RepID=UPI003CCCACF6
MDFPGRPSREFSGASSLHDIMNDPAYDTNRKGKEREHEEPDSCRICRGEATEQDQLYHPCKCSGSIRFVHQPCLVQWLAHSQKKHCELCKTPFHFTKVYDPDMPDSLPAFLFMKQMFIHVFRTAVTWLRWVLVAFVWLGWLPWSMRAIWRALFWLADGRWSSGDASHQGMYNVSSNETLGTSSAGATGQTTPPAQSMFDFAGEPVLLKLMRKAFSTLFFPSMASSFGSTNSSNTTSVLNKRRPSWLSDVKFLNSLTPSPTINNILIDTLEGQLITLLVVVSFILIFLIREWVVQQQPLDNIAEGEREAADQLIANNRAVPQAEVPEPEPEPEQEPEAREEVPEDILQERERDIRAEDSVEEGHIEIQRPPPELVLPNRDIAGLGGPGGLGHLLAEGPLTPPIRRNFGDNDGFNFDLPAYHRTSQLNLTQPNINSELYRELWNRTNGDAQEMLRLVREEGRYEELAYHVTAFYRQLQAADRYPRSPLSDSNSVAHVTDSLDNVDSAFSETSELIPQRRDGPDVFETHSPNIQSDLLQSSSHSLQSEIHAGHLPGLHIPEAEPKDRPQGTPLTPDQSDGTIGNSVPGSDLAVGDADSVEDARSSAESSQTIAEPPKTLTRKVVDWFWADVILDDLNQGPQADVDDDVLVEAAVDEPLAHPGHVENLDVNGNPPEDPEFPDIGGDANDLDAIEEADDLEGILELIGMQGPIFGLLQNGVFCALLISFTVAAGIWLPYLAGKIALVLFASPIQFILGVPMTAVSVFADVVLDTLIGSLGYIMYWTTLICKLFLSPLGTVIPLEWTKSVTTASLSLIDASSQRLGSVINNFFVFHEADVPMFSVISHHALKIHEARIGSLVRLIFLLGKLVLYDFPLQIGSLEISKIFSLSYSLASFGSFWESVSGQMHDVGYDLYSQFYSNSTSWINSSVPGVSGTLDSSLAVWDTKDRTIAILLGYFLASSVGLGYLRVARFFSGADRGQRVEGMVAEGLHQAGGVMKVILIIGIEMIVFPLYCGALLDIALLPLFENATAASRLEFTSTHPLTSLFVHWFIGTCYMFHFALFVSMCRKTMRSGVLYFIRDPDDPTFHPVRDVLERNITTQLRKIAFSALVYGALVIVCLGGVVWGIYYGFDGVLPAHWSSKDPVLEFPIDLLLYNFGIPLAIRAFKPSDALHSLYSWWFKKCARFLRLSHFFFDERHLDEEGIQRHAWWSLLLPGKEATENAEEPATQSDQQTTTDENPPVADLKRDGKFVRAPASDQVRIPKGSPVFLEVSETNEPIDGKPDTETGLHGRANEQFTLVYIPPFFRTRIAAFLIMIWLFAAATGVGTTIIPLVIGRRIMSVYVPGRPVNDVYALSVGLGVVSAVAATLFYCRTLLNTIIARLSPYVGTPREASRALSNDLTSVTGLIYIAAAFTIFLPSIFALAIQLYVLVPIHTYLGRDGDHVIHFVQDWTLGVLYVQMAVKVALWNSRSRPAAILNGIFHDGWLQPNVKLATRALLLPMTILALIAVTLPLTFGFVVNLTMFSSHPEMNPVVYRYAYPATLAMGLLAWVVYLACRQVEVWQVSIRDEFFLIGERLHNFREKRAREVGVGRRDYRIIA